MPLTFPSKASRRGHRLVQLGLSCRYKRFFFCLGSSSLPSTKYFFLTVLQFLCLYRPASWAGSRAESPVCLWSRPRKAGRRRKVPKLSLKALNVRSWWSWGQRWCSGYVCNYGCLTVEQEYSVQYCVPDTTKQFVNINQHTREVWSSTLTCPIRPFQLLCTSICVTDRMYISVVDPWHLGTDPDPDPVIFVLDLQDANKKRFFS